MKAILIATKTDDELIKAYAELVNITRKEEQEIKFQVIKYELEKRAAL